MIMKDYIELGSAPYDEDCVCVSSTKPYIEEMTKECRRYADLLREKCPIPDGINAHYAIKTFQHDFGSYKEVCICFDDEDEDACEFAFNIESIIPSNWGDSQ